MTDMSEHAERAIATEGGSSVPSAEVGNCDRCGGEVVRVCDAAAKATEILETDGSPHTPEECTARLERLGKLGPVSTCRKCKGQIRLDPKDEYADPTELDGFTLHYSVCRQRIAEQQEQKLAEHRRVVAEITESTEAHYRNLEQTRRMSEPNHTPEQPKAERSASQPQTIGPASQSAIGGVILTVAEVRELTQRERWHGQAAALEALGIPYSKRPVQDGKVSLLVLREHAVSRLKERAQPKAAA